MRKLLLLGFISAYSLLTAQTILVLPYLQKATPNGIFALWETDQGEESTLEWGLTTALGNTTTGNTTATASNTRMHEVQLTGLERTSLKAGIYFFIVRQAGVILGNGRFVIE